MRYILFLFLPFLLSNPAFSQEIRLQKGKVIDSMSIPGKKDTYALYIPKSFDLQKEHHVVFVFDSAGGNKTGISQFVLAAETFGLVIVASNDIKNDIGEASFGLYNNLHEHIFSIFPKLSDKVYLAGFSDGARLATTIGVLSNSVAGVIASGASFAHKSVYYPRENKFPFIGIVGDEDFNYQEMKRAQRYVKRKKIPNELLIYEGAHEWPSPEYITQAFEWLYIKHTIKGDRPGHEERTKKLYAKHYQYAISLFGAKKYFLAEKAFARLEKNYRSYYNTDSILARIERIKKLKEYKRFKREDSNLGYYESNLANYFKPLLEEDIKNASFQNFDFWDEELQVLKEFDEGSINKQKTAKRLRNLLFFIGLKSLPSYNEEKGMDNLIFINEFLVYLKPEYHEGYLSLIKYYTIAGEYRNALSSMETLFKNGYTNKNQIRLMPGIALLKAQPGFWEILDGS